MAGLKEIRTRITSVTSTQKITSAMKMVSAAKFHKSFETINRFNPYSKKIFDILYQILPAINSIDSNKWFSPPQSNKNIALIVLTSNSSMCGGFNQNIIKKVIEDGPKLFPDVWSTDQLDIFCLGKKGADFFTKKGYKTIQGDSLIINKPLYKISAEFCNGIMESFQNGRYDSVYIAYNSFKNPALQVPEIKQFLPFLPITETKPSEVLDPDMIFEPSEEYIMSVLVPKALNVFFHRVVLENAAGEHGARMSAMHQATDNANELIKELKLQYNKARQAAITKEILEIVSGAEALKG